MLLPTAVLFCSTITVDAAAKRALAEVTPESRQHHAEYGGVLYAKGPDVCATVPDSGGGGEVQIVATLPAGAKLVGLYHTHPFDVIPGSGGAESSDEFSEADVDAANRLRVPSYIYVLRSGALRRFTPGIDRTTITTGYDENDDEVPLTISFGTLVK